MKVAIIAIVNIVMAMFIIAAETDNVPAELRDFLLTEQGNARKLLEKQIASGAIEPMGFNFKLGQVAKTTDFRNKEAGAWLVTYEVGILPGQGLIPYRRACLVNKDFEVIARFPDEEVGIRLSEISLPEKQKCYAFVVDQGRPYPAAIRIWSGDANPKLLAKLDGDASPPQSISLYRSSGDDGSVILLAQIITHLADEQRATTIWKRCSLKTGDAQFSAWEVIQATDLPKLRVKIIEADGPPREAPKLPPVTSTAIP